MLFISDSQERRYGGGGLLEQCCALRWTPHKGWVRTHYLEANIIINPNYVTLLPQFYGYLSQQQNMLQDYVRTSTYQRAILDNHTDFDGKIVLDVGAGSGTTFLQKKSKNLVEFDSRQPWSLNYPHKFLSFRRIFPSFIQSQVSCHSLLYKRELSMSTL